MANDTVHVRYLVKDVDAAVAFYTTRLDFSVLSIAAPAFADVKRGCGRRGPRLRVHGQPGPTARGGQSQEPW